MGARLFVCGLILFALGASAREFDSVSPTTAPTNKAAFCAMHKNYGWVRAQLFNPANKLSFQNPGGLVDAGLCWWHSRMQRAATYLADFRPSEKRPSLARLFIILDSLFSLRSVQVIPGFANFQAFSKAYEPLIIAYLSQMQIYDTLNFEFLKGLRPVAASPSFIRHQAESIYQQVAVKDKIEYVALKGLRHWYESHAWLFVGAMKSGQNIDFYYVDSNDSPQVVPNHFTYAPGQTTLNGRVPYLQHDTDFWWIDLAVNQYCQ